MMFLKPQKVVSKNNFLWNLQVMYGLVGRIDGFIFVGSGFETGHVHFFLFYVKKNAAQPISFEQIKKHF